MSPQHYSTELVFWSYIGIFFTRIKKKSTSLLWIWIFHLYCDLDYILISCLARASTHVFYCVCHADIHFVLFILFSIFSSQPSPRPKQFPCVQFSAAALSSLLS